MNWGTKLLLAMGLFITFIVGMGTKMILSKGDDLVENDYYEKGLDYDKSYNRELNAVRDSVIPAFYVDEYALSISFRYPAKYKLICKRPSNAKLDKIYQGTTDEDRCVIIPRKNFRKGPWLFRLEFTVNEKEYLVEKEIIMP
ncbi:FixH family protein [Rubrolithibacter danxiaensis]|uniref:FixH family protein n=1 Tax=Rubrolithibacter danxiaensis TaxID=3390805 RepID=UPI003BF85072